MFTTTYKDQTFEITTKIDRRVVAFDKGTPVYGENTQYNIHRDGQLVGFVFDETDVQPAIRRMVDFPNEAEAVHCRFD